MNLEQLGNFTYGYIGGALGLSSPMLIGGSWFAAGHPMPLDLSIALASAFGPGYIYNHILLSLISPGEGLWGSWEDFVDEITDWNDVMNGFNAYHNARCID